MDGNSFFNINRFGNLLRKDLNENLRGYMVNSMSISAFLFIIMLLFARTQNLTIYFYSQIFFFFLFLSGLLYTSKTFKDAHTKYLNHYWLMLPCSVFEKFFLKLILSSVIFIIAYTSLFTVVIGFGYLFIKFVFGIETEVFNPFRLYVLKGSIHYLILQSVFFLGAVWFKNKNFMKTGFSISCLLFFINILLILITYLFFHGYIAKFQTDELAFQFSQSFIFNNFQWLGEIAIKCFKIFYYFILAPLCWSAAFFKLKKIEAKDGI